MKNPNSKVVTNSRRTKKTPKTRTLKQALRPVRMLQAHNRSRMALRLRKRKIGRTWQNVATRWYPGIKPSTLRRFAVDKTYTPKDPAILQQLGLCPLPPLITDILGIIYG